MLLWPLRHAAALEGLSSGGMRGRSRRNAESRPPTRTRFRPPPAAMASAAEGSTDAEGARRSWMRELAATAAAAGLATPADPDPEAITGSIALTALTSA